MKSFYLYLDNFSFSDIYSMNTIACESFSHNKKGAKTLSRNTNDYLFLTHKKVDLESRYNGIEDKLTGWPVTLEIAINEEMYASYPVVLVAQNGESYEFTLAEISDYDNQKHIGCFVFACVPFSTVINIFFENKDQLFDSDKSIFPDFMWKQDMVSVINQEEFDEQFEITVSDEEIQKVAGNKVDASSLCLEINKYQAALLQMVNGTAEWIVGKYKASFDDSLLKILGIPNADVEAELRLKNMPSAEQILSKGMDNIDLFPLLSECEKDTTTEQSIYNIIVSTFVNNKDKCTPECVSLILGEIKDKTKNVGEGNGLSEILDSIEGCSRNAIGFSVDETLKSIEEQFGTNAVLKALFFVMKNPTEFEKFVLSLSIYKVDSITARHAMILWGYLNGTRGIPARNYNRDNDDLWITIENIFYSNSAISRSELPCMKKRIDNSFCGINISCEEIISYDEVYHFLIENKKSITTTLLKDIYSIVKNMDRKIAKEDPYCVYAINEENFYSLIPKAKSALMTKTEIDAFEKDCAKKVKSLITSIKKKPEYDYAGIYEAYIFDEKKFKKIWEVYEAQLKTFYVKARDKNE